MTETQNAPYIVIGLGNPGREYKDTRHNVGFMVIDQLCKAMGIRLGRVQAKALVGTGTLEGSRLVVAKPQTFMNDSGKSVGGLLCFYKVPLDQLMIVHDDLDLPFGTLRLRPGGGSAGQRGMASIIRQLGSQDFARLRFGIGRPPGQMDPAAYVLQRFRNSELPTLNIALERSVEAVRTFMHSGIETAMNAYNGTVLDTP